MKAQGETFRTIVVISSDMEWDAVTDMYPDIERRETPYGRMFRMKMPVHGREEQILFFQGGWGKIAAAASTQYALSRWAPELLVNLGTCGGFQGEIQRDEIILVERTIVYDIMEAMTEPEESLRQYSTVLDLDWLGGDYPIQVKLMHMVSGDRDIRPEDIAMLKERFGAKAADWESASIAWVAARNGTPCLILRGVSDLVGQEGGEAYDGNVDVFRDNAARILGRLIRTLPAWLERLPR